MNKQMTLIGACKQFFGLKEGETLQQFMQEFKVLTTDDRLELTELFKGEGIEITATPQN